MRLSRLQAKKGSLQRGEKFRPHFKALKKSQKIFCVFLSLLFLISNASAQEISFIPAGLGTVMDSYRFNVDSPGGAVPWPLIVHIQDAHETFPVQEKIAGLIHWLAAEHQFGLVFEEGNSGPIDTRSVFWAGPERFRRRLAEQFLREGKITGAEFAHITARRPFRLFGAEKARLYEKNVRSLEQLDFYKSEVENQLRKIDRQLRSQIPAVFSRELQQYYEQSRNFWKGYGLPPFPVPMDQASWDASFLKRIETVDRQTRDGLVTTPEQRELIEKLETVEVLRKMGNLRMTRDDFEIYKDRSEHVNRLLGNDLILKEFFMRAMEFYHLARERDFELIKNTLERMMAFKSDRAVLVSGGFHTAGISDFLRENGISYVVVSPVSSQTDGETLREPNLFNLTAAEASLLVDLRAMSQTPEGSGLYRQLLDHARKMWPQIPDRHVPSPPADFPAAAGREGVVALLSLPRLPSESALAELADWAVELEKTRAVDVVLGLTRARDVQAAREFFKKRFAEEHLRRGVRIVRLLTPRDFTSARQFLDGKFLLLLASKDERSRLELAGVAADQFFVFSPSPYETGRERLALELEMLQKTYHSIVIAA